MTKLEQKLIKLGYNKTYGLYWKKLCGKATILLKKCCNEITEYYIPKEDYLSDLDIDFANKKMQKDLEELKKYEEICVIK